MDTTELDNVQALLDRVRPDPAGFAQRLLTQVVARFGDTRWADVGQPAPTAYYAEGDVQPDERAVPHDSYGTQDSYVDEGLVDTNILLAAALGACACWGLRADCAFCRGAGTPGWTLPDRDLFTELVEPAVARMAAVPPDEGASGTDRSTAQGVAR